MNDNSKLNQVLQYATEITIRIGFLLLITAWCFQILYPFAGIIVWGVILAMAMAPAYVFLKKRLGVRSMWAAAILIICGLAIIILPSYLFFDSMIEGAKEFNTRLENGTLTIPPPSEKVAGWPLIGSQIYDIWKLASENLMSLFSKYQEQITKVAELLFKGILDAGGSIIQFVLSMIIAGILLVTKGTDGAARKFFKKLAGTKGDEFTDITIKTVNNVTRGVLGVALIQAILVGLGFILAGVPYAGIWALLVLILAILQLTASIITIPVIIYLFSVLNPLPATLWTIYLFLAGLSDNVLKPLLLGKGAPVPMLVIFLGVIGGFILSGFIGLFTGAIVLSLGYKLLQAWLGTEDIINEKVPAG